MKIFEKDLLFNELVFDFQLNEGDGSFACNQMWFDPNGAEIKHVATFAKDLGATYPAWVIEQIGSRFITTLDFAWVLDTTEPYLALGQAYPPFDRLVTNDAFTIEVAFYADAASAHHALVAGHVEEVSGSGPAFPQLAIDSNGYFDFRPCRDSAGAGGYVNGSVDLTAGWHHMVAAYDNSDDIAYVEVDGGDTDSGYATMDTTTNVYDVVTAAESVFIGARYNADTVDHESFFDGHMAFARMWARRLTAIERRELFERCRSDFDL